MRSKSGSSNRIQPQYFASVALLFLGIAAVVWLVRANDCRAVVHTLTTVGGGLVLVVLLRGAVITTCGIAWWRLLRRLSTAPVGVAVGLRTISEAINVLLPVAAVGGDIVRAMLLRSRRVPGGVAA